MPETGTDHRRCDQERLIDHYDVEVFWDPSCPFAWLTSVWVRRIAALRDLEVGWRFFMPALDEPDEEQDPALSAARDSALGFGRVCAAARSRLGNAAVGDLYGAYGDQVWNARPDGPLMERAIRASTSVRVDDLLVGLGLGEDLAAEADHPEWDQVLRADTAVARQRVGPGLGTPVVSFGFAGGASIFGPVINAVPDTDSAVLALFDAVATIAEFDAFAEVKRTKLPPIALPLFEG